MNKKILVLNYEFPPLGGGASPVSWELDKRNIYKVGNIINISSFRTVSMIPGNQSVAGCFCFFGGFYG